MRPALVILAAGESRRLGECKALVDLGGKCALDRLLDAAAGLSDAAPIVVTGLHHRAIAARASARAEIVENPDWRAGRASGVLLAHRRFAERDLCIAPVDVPLVPRAVFEALFREWSRAGAPPRGWLAPRLDRPGSENNSRHGHPVIAGRRLLDELARADPPHTLQRLRASADPLMSVAVAHPEILDDLDTPEDLARLRARELP